MLLYMVYLNEFLFEVLIGSIIFQTSGPLLPISLASHSMVRLGKGQAIIGGNTNANYIYQSKIYLMTCLNRYCIISLLSKELSVPKETFVAIPIPDEMSGCITGGKYIFKSVKISIQPKIIFTLKYSMPVSDTNWRWSLPGF